MWSGRGLQIEVPVSAVPSGQKIEIVAKICETDHFIFPEGTRPISPVYELSTTPSLPSFQKEVKISMDHSASDHALLCFVNASRVPRWNGKLIPMYEFHNSTPFNEFDSKIHSQTGVIFLSQLDCYLAVVVGEETSKKYFIYIHTAVNFVRVFRKYIMHLELIIGAS